MSALQRHTERTGRTPTLLPRADVLVTGSLRLHTTHAMKKSPAPYGLHITQSCLACRAREESLFCQLGPAALEDLNKIRQASLYPKGAVLFVAGQPAHGLFVLCSGKAKLTTSSAQGRVLIVRVAGTGEVLGLSAVMSDATYETSAETLEPSEISFLPRNEFLQFLQKHGEVSLRVAQHLSMELRHAYEQATRIALAPTARAKLAGLLLEWGGIWGDSPGKTLHFELLLTHEEIGELIGSSRETVSRLLSDFRRKGLVQIHGISITIPDRAKLAAILG